MKQFISYLQQAKITRLAEYEETLAQELTDRLQDKADLLSQLKIDEKKLSQELVLRQQAESQYASQQRVNSKLTLVQRAELQTIWHQTVDEHFAKKDLLEKWLIDQISALPKEKGEVRAGDSFSILSRILGKQKDYSLVRDDILKGEAGFIYESDRLMVDARLSLYLDQAYQENEAALARIIFHD
jgi:hypothetical protein